MRNPLYHWTHLELRTAFGIQDILKEETARDIYERCNKMLAMPEFSARGLMRKYHVEVVCTTDDPAAQMEYPDAEVAQKWAEIVEMIQSGIMDDYNASMLGKTMEILVDGYDEEMEQFFGRTYADSPEIDG